MTDKKETKTEAKTVAKTDQKEIKTEAKTETPLPKGVDQKTMSMALEVVKSGYEANQDPDAIKSALFSKGITFSKLARIFNYAAVQLGYEVDQKTLKEKIEKEMKNVKLTYKESYEELAALAAKLAEPIKGASPARFITMFKKSFTDAEKTFPRKTAPARGRIGAINKAIIDVFAANPKATEKDLFTALEKVTKNPQAYTAAHYKMAYALANKLTTLQMLTVVAKQAEKK